MPNILAMPGYEAALACFLLGVYLLISDTPELSYYHLGLSMKLALLEGLHKKQADRPDAEIRRRVWWSLYSLDRYARQQQSDLRFPSQTLSPSNTDLIGLYVSSWGIQRQSERMRYQCPSPNLSRL